MYSGAFSVLSALKDLPEDNLEEDQLRAALTEVFERDWRLSQSQAEDVAELYLICLHEALLEVETEAFLVVGRSVLRTEEAVKRLEQALREWREKEEADIRKAFEDLDRRLEAIQRGVEGLQDGQHRIEELVRQIVEPMRCLRVDYAGRIENFLLEYLGTPEKPVPFGGRDVALAELTNWLKDAKKPYCLLTAPAGRGKSALLVRWLEEVRRTHPEMAVAFVPVSIRFGTNLASVTFAALAAQLARAFGEEIPSDPSTPAEVWKGIVDQYLRREPPSGGLLVVLDGLDEAADWDVDAGLFPRDPKPCLKIVVSARLTALRPQDEDWLRALGWEHLPVQTLDLAPLDQAGLRDVLEKMGVPLDELARRPFIVEELYRLTEGDPLLVRFYVEDLWGRGEDALRLEPEDLQNLEPGYEGYFKRWWEDQRKLWGKEAPLRERGVREVLNLLATAMGPLPKKDLLGLAQPEAQLDSWTLEETLRPLARFVVQTAEGYVFGHPKLGDFFFGRLAPNEQQELEARFLRWGEEVLRALEEGHLVPKKAPAYVVRYYRAHLRRAKAPIEAFRRLVETEAWARAWEALEGSFGGYLSDVQAVWNRAVQENETYLETTSGMGEEGDPLPEVGLEVRCALIKSSIHSLASNLPPKLPALLVENDLWTPAQALAHVRQMPEEWQKIEALKALAPVLAEKAPETMPEALELAREIGDEFHRVEVLAALAPHLPEDLLREALEIARGIGDEEYRVEALAALAPHLLEDLLREALREALEIARLLPEEGLLGSPRVEALAALAPHLPEDLRREALEIVRGIKDGRYRVWALSALAPHLPEGLKREALEEVLEIARGIRYEDDRVKVLAALAPYLPEEQKREVLKEALEIAREIEYGKYRARIKVFVVRASRWAKLAPQELYPLWRETLSVLAARPRKNLLGDLRALVPVIHALGGRAAVAETFRAVQDVGRWWP